MSRCRAGPLGRPHPRDGGSSTGNYALFIRVAVSDSQELQTTTR